MMTFEQFYAVIAPKFEGWLWADYEAKFFGDDLYIKASTDFWFYQDFDLYIRNAKAMNFDSEWTVDLRYENILEARHGGLYFATDDPDTHAKITVTGTEFLASIYDIYYLGPPLVPRSGPSRLDGTYFNLEGINSMEDLDRFEHLILN